MYLFRERAQAEGGSEGEGQRESQSDFPLSAELKEGIHPSNLR